MSNGTPSTWSTKHAYPTWGERIVKFMSRSAIRPPLVLLIILCTTVLAATVGKAFNFSSNTSGVTITPSPELTESWSAFSEINNAFPRFTASETEFVIVTRRNGAPILDDSSDPDNKKLQSFLGNITTGLRQAALVAKQSVSIESCYSYPANLSALGFNLVSQNSTIVVVRGIDATDSSSISAFNEEADKYVSMVSTNSEYFIGDLLGQSLLMEESQKKTGIGFAIADGSGLPAIIVLFWYMVGSPRLLLPTGIAVASSLISSYATGNLFVLAGISVPMYEPNIMLFLCLALSIDYSFFLLTRFQEERESRGADFNEALSRSLTHSGATIMLSGGVLIIQWLALALFPVYNLDAVGYCSAVTVLFCILSNLIILPSLMLTFREFFSKASFDMSKSCCCFSSSSGKCVNDFMDESVDTTLLKHQVRGAFTKSRSSEEPSLKVVSLSGKSEAKEKNCYDALGRMVTRAPFKYIVPFVVFGIFVSGCTELIGAKLSLALNINLGESTKAKSYSNALATFRSAGLVHPFAIISTPKQNIPDSEKSILSESHFSVSCKVAKSLSSVEGLVPQSLQGIAFDVDYTDGGKVNCISSKDAKNKVETDAYYAHRFSSLANVKFGTDLITFSPSFNPFGPKIENFVVALRNRLENVSDTHNFQLYSAPVTEVDAKNFVYHRLPGAVFGSLALIFVLVAVRFRAAIVPIKLFLTIVVPILFMYGIAIVVFQKGALNWTGWPTVSSTGADGLSWLLPTSTIFLLVGLALDYDIFLFARVFELRSTGKAMSDEEAVVDAVAATGSIISAAGVIMALAFSGMLFNSNRYLNQFGFVCICSILLDTFVVRILLVPSLLSIGGWINWWPRKMPQNETRAKTMLREYTPPSFV